MLIKGDLSGPGLKAFFAIVERFGIREVDARSLLGGVGSELYSEMKQHPNRYVLDAEALERISLLIGIFKAVHVVHAQPLAEEWITLPNAGPVFSGKRRSNI